MKRKIWLFLVLAAASNYGATTHTWTGGGVVNNWNSADNYSTKKVPAAGDIVEVGNFEVTIDADDEESYNVAKQLETIYTTSSSAKVIINVSTGTATNFLAQVRAKSDNASLRGTLAKTGKGVLKCGKVTDVANQFYINFDIREGELWLPQQGGSVAHKCGNINVETNATLVTWNTSARISPCGSISGSGCISNTVANGTQILPAASVIYARLYNVSIYAGNNVSLMRTDNYMPTCDVYQKNVLSYVSLSPDKGCSSIGYGSDHAINFAEQGGGTYLYLGEGGETTAKTISFYGTDLPVTTYPSDFSWATLDMGHRGGVTFTGMMKLNTATGTYVSRNGMGICTLTGSNTLETVFNGSVSNNYAANKSGIKAPGGYSIFFHKKGSGKWRFAGDALDTNKPNRQNWTGFRIDEGSFAFDSIQEKGYFCALGLATNTQERYSGLYEEDMTVPYAYRIGLPEIKYPAANLARFEYAGQYHSRCSTRPIALNGDAILSNRTNSRFRVWNVSAINPGVNTLVLDGVGEESEVGNVSDGDDGCQVGIVKTGKGKWTLVGNQTFSGPLAVEEGTLVVRKPSRQYSWYRLVVNRGTVGKDVRPLPANSSTRSDEPDDIPKNYDSYKLGRIALFDEFGYRQAAEMKCCPVKVSAGTITPSVLNSGEIGWGARDVHGMNISNCTNYLAGADSKSFSGATEFKACSDKSCVWFRRDDKVHATIGDPKSWQIYEFRLTNNTPLIVGYDLATIYGASNTIHYANWNPTGWKMEASVDGVNWNTLHEVEDGYDFSDTNKMHVAFNNYSWYKMGRAVASTETKDTVYTGFQKFDADKIYCPEDQIPSVLNNVGEVSVGAGATLEADGEITLSKLKVDKDIAVDDAGTIKGFNLSNECTVEVPGLEAGFNGALPLNIEGVPEETRTEWVLTVDGKVRPARSVVLRGGKLMVSSTGLGVTIR